MEIKLEEFGRDHWSMFAYVESLCVDSINDIGMIDRRKVRCNKDNRPLLSAGNPWRDQYSTRLKGAFGMDLQNDFDKAIENRAVVLGHDDWDCLDDLDKHGLVEIINLANCAVKMTKKGTKMASKLREHKASGGQFATFSI